MTSSATTPRTKTTTKTTFLLSALILATTTIPQIQGADNPPYSNCAISDFYPSSLTKTSQPSLHEFLKVNHRKTTFQQQLWRGIRINSRNLVKELLITIPILLLKFIPIKSAEGVIKGK